MKRLLWVMLFFILAVWLGLHVAKDPGYALFAYQHWTVQMPLWIAALFIVLIIFLIHQLLLLWRGTTGLAKRLRLFSTRRQQERSSHYTKRGLTALTEGKWHHAEKWLLRGAKHNQHPLVNYLAAARAAQEQGCDERRDAYLQQAHVVAPSAKMAVGLTQAQLQLGYQQLEQSLATLKQLQHMAPSHSEVIKLLKDLYIKLADWPALIELLPDIKKQKLLSDDTFAALSFDAYQGWLLQLAKTQKSDVVINAWQQMPKSLRRNTTLVAVYAHILIDLHADNDAEKLLRETLKHEWDPALVTLYGDVQSSDLTLQMDTAQGWLKHHGQSADLALCLGQLSRQLALWGQAKTYLAQSLSLQPSAKAYVEQGLLFEALNEMEPAYESFKAGLLCATNLQDRSVE